MESIKLSVWETAVIEQAIETHTLALAEAADKSADLDPDIYANQRDSLLELLRKLNSAVEVRLVYNTLEPVQPTGQVLDTVA